ncbi:hypothetical protein ACR3K2_15530 [Cryptosporidium serpentis]
MDSDSDIETHIIEDIVESNSLTGPKLILNSERILYRAEEIRYKSFNGIKEIPFIETLAITTPINKYDLDIDYKDSLAREIGFHNTALNNVKEACNKLSDLGIKWNRPNDMLAEMLKSDAQMKSIKADLLKQEEKIKAVENRKKRTIEKKFTKKIQVEKKKLKAQEKKNNIKEIERWKENRDKSIPVEESFDKFFNNKKVVKNSKNKQGKNKSEVFKKIGTNSKLKKSRRNKNSKR